jgi:hypothetical protein
MATFAALYGTLDRGVCRARSAPRRNVARTHPALVSVGRRRRRAASRPLAITTAVYASARRRRRRADGIGLDPDLPWVRCGIAAAVALALPVGGRHRALHAGALARLLPGIALPRPEARADFADAPRARA